MKYLTKNLLIHILILIPISFLFRYLLSHTLSNDQFIAVWIVAGIYALTVYTMNWRFAVLDKKSLPIYDLGFRFHLATYVVWVAVSYIWFKWGTISVHEHISQVHISALYWLIALVVHFLIYLVSRKKTLKGLKKSEIFD